VTSSEKSHSPASVVFPEGKAVMSRHRAHFVDSAGHAT